MTLKPAEAAPEAKAIVASEPDDKDTDSAAENAFKLVLKNGPEVMVCSRCRLRSLQLDHYIIYHAHYEFGKLYASRGDVENAKAQFDVVMSGMFASDMRGWLTRAGKLLEANRHEQKSQGKYSLEQALLLKTHSAIQSLKEDQEKKGKKMP